MLTTVPTPIRKCDRVTGHSTPDPQVLVIGAGIAGLTAAFVLHQRGVSVRVLESTARVGGRMTTDLVGGRVIDRGAQFLSTGYPMLSSLVRRLGLSSEWVRTTPWTAVVRDGRVIRFRYDDALSSLWSGLLRPQEIWTLARQSLGALSTVRRPINDYGRWSDVDVTDAASWYDQQFGPWMTEYLVEPMLQGFYFQSPEETSCALPRAIAGFLTQGAHTSTLRGGIGRLPSALAEHLDVCLNQPVLAIEPQRDSVAIETQEGWIRAGRVILAIPAPQALQLLRSTSEAERLLLSTTYSSTLNLSLGLDGGWRPPDSLNDVYGLLIPRLERRRIAAVAFEKAKDSTRTLDGHLINVMVDGRSGAEMIAWDEARVLQEVLQELDRWLPGASVAVDFHRLYRWERAEPRSPVGRASAIAHYRAVASTDQRLLLAGDYMSMPFTEGAAESGRWAAHRVLHHLGQDVA